MMPTDGINIPRFLWAGLAAGAWVFFGGLLMAASFGYRDMKAAFDAVRLPTPVGAQPFIVHTLVRFTTGLATVLLFVLLLPWFSPTWAMLAAAGFTWLLGVLLPFAVVVQWGLFSWSLAGKFWMWSAAELLLAATIGRLVYHP